MVVGALKITLHLPQVGGLKPKRKVVRSIKDRVAARFKVAVAEVGAQDLWQRIELGFAFCGNDGGHVRNQIDTVARFVESLGLAEVVDVRIEVMHLKEMAWEPCAPDEWAN